MIVGFVTRIPNDLQKYRYAITSSAARFKLVNSAPKVDVITADYRLAYQFIGVLPSNPIKPVIDFPVTLSWP